ncbi:MAG: hypothetical protein AB1631_31470 [Acidobacteriota bacterium]
MKTSSRIFRVLVFLFILLLVALGLRRVWIGESSAPMVVYQGGTGNSAISSGQFVVGSGGEVMTKPATSSLFWDNTNTRLAVGTASPTERLHVSGGNVLADSTTDFNPQLQVRHIGSTAGSAGYVLFGRARAGTTDVVNGDFMGTFIGQGFSSGAYRNSAWFYFAVDGTPSGSSVPGAINFTTVNSSGTAGVRFRINSTGVANFYSGAAVASASSITPTGNVFHVTGTTTITSITSTGITAGTTITMIFDGALTFTDGGNLRLNGNFVTTADDTITLVYDGSNWFEVARSVN